MMFPIGDKSSTKAVDSGRSAHHDRRPGFLRKSALWVLTAVLVVGTLEFVSWVAFSIVSGEEFSYSVIQSRRNERSGGNAESALLTRATPGGPAYLSRQVVHPYIGFVEDPTNRKHVNSFGFFGPAPIGHTEANAGTVSIAVLGGSVATYLVVDGRKELESEIERIGRYTGRKIHIANLALGGMKQPQQLMAMNYFLSLGAHFDIVINLDGFNDIVLSVQNHRVNTFPFYPRAWNLRVAGHSNRHWLRNVGQIAYLENIQSYLPRIFSYAPLRYSVTANLIWDQLDLGMQKSIENKRRVLAHETLSGNKTRKQDSRYVETGPERSYASDDERYRAMADYWKRSSMMLNDLARGNGFLYFHFLQPNQYVPNSKIFSAEERAIALTGEGVYEKAATEGYPYLIEAGEQLPEAGVNFTDLTMMFGDNDEVLYSDNCCHFNKRGTSLIVREIGRVIRALVDDSP